MALTAIGPSRVRLETWNDLEKAASEGLLDERTHCELKRGVGPSSQNDEIACDLASLSVEGGVLLYGVTDAGAGKAGEVGGVPSPESLKTRLIALAQGRVQPSLACDVRVVLSNDGPDVGCVIVEVPPSAVAPHRAADRYWGRSSEGKRVLSDAETQLLFASRRNRTDDFLDHLRSLEGEFDQIPQHLRKEGHLYFSARPLQGGNAAPPWDSNKRLHELIHAVRMPQSGFGGFDLESVTYGEAHPDGIQAVVERTSDLLLRSEDDRESMSLRALVRDDGSIDVAYGGATRSWTPSQGAGERVQAVPSEAVILVVDQCVRLTGHIARERGENGLWRLGVRLNGLAGRAAMFFYTHTVLAPPKPFQLDVYERQMDATAGQMLDEPAEVVQALMSRLARGLGLEQVHFPYATPGDLFRGR